MPAEHPQRERVLTRASGVAALLTLGILFWPVALRRVFVYGDLGNYSLPMRLFLAESLQRGITPLWMPHLFCGFYVHAESGAFHPARWLLYRFLPFSEAFNIECIASFPLAVIGLALFVRRLGLPTSAALFGGICFGLSPYLTVRFNHLQTLAVFAHLGWVLLALDIALREKARPARDRAWLAIAALTGSQLLIGYPPALAYCLIVEISYLLFVAVSLREWRPSLVAITALVAGFGLGAVQVIPTLDVLISSQRAYPSLDQLTAWSLHPFNLLLSLAPWLFARRTYFGDLYDPIEQVFYFGAVVPLALLWVLLRWRQLGALRRLVVSSLALSGLALLAALGRYTVFYQLILAIPGLGLLRAPARYIVLLTFTGALIAAIAFADLLHADPRRARRESWFLWLVPALSWLIAGSALALRADPAAWGQVALAAKLNEPWLLLLSPLVFTLAAALFFAAARGARSALLGLVVLSLADSSSYAASLWWADPPRTIPEYLAGTVRPPVTPGSRVATAFDTLILSRPDRLPRYWMSTSLIVHDVRLVSGYAAIVPSRQLDYWRTASLRVAGASLAFVDDLHYEPLPRALPRARMVAVARRSYDPRAQIEQINVATTALVDDPVDLVSGPPGKAVIEQDLPGRIRVATDAPTRQLLVLSESFHAGWQVTVDGEPRPLIRVNGDFMGCVVDAGHHVLRFHFAPRSYQLGVWISLASVTAILAFALHRLHAHHRNRRDQVSALGAIDTSIDL